MNEAIIIIPARKGSKRLPGKNVMRIDGKPLISYSIQTGLGIGGRVLVASDDKEIGILATEMGAEWIPLPDSLTQDDSSLLPVLQYCLSLNLTINQQNPTWTILLQPTCPLRNLDLILEWKSKATAQTDAIISVDKQGYKLGFKDGYYFQPEYALFSQKRTLAPKMRENGVFYMFRTDQILRGEIGSRIIPVDTPTEQSLANIDTLFDFDLACYLYDRYNYAQFFPPINTTFTGAQAG